jgi:hypothetical protein
MKKTLLILAALCAFVCDLSAEPVKIKNSQIDDLARALVELDGYSRVLEASLDAAGQAVPAKEVHLSYAFSGATRFTIAHDIAALQEASTLLQKTKESIIKQVMNGGSSIDAKDLEHLTKFYALFLEVWNKEEVLNLDRLTPAMLCADTNPLPPSLIVRLSPLIDYKAQK